MIPEMKYEVEHVCFTHYYIESELSMLTGLPLDEILAVSRNVTRWTGQQYVRVLNSLGYSTNQRFVPFDRKTKYPCLMRTRIPHDKYHWFGAVYYDDKVYLPLDGVLTWQEFNHFFPNYRVTSMLQVWL